MTCQDIIEIIEPEMLLIDLNHLNQSFPKDNLKPVNFTPYYRALASYAQCFEIDQFLELGTSTGISSAVVAPFVKKVDTYDISNEYLCQLPENVHFHLLKEPEDCLNALSNDYPMIFIDIDHSGFYEKKLHEKLTEMNYKGTVFYDDIGMNPEMSNFWNNISQDKIAKRWNLHGFGVVRY